jgi:radical SAM superfamily enzyme
MASPRVQIPSLEKQGTPKLNRATRIVGKKPQVKLKSKLTPISEVKHSAMESTWKNQRLQGTLKNEYAETIKFSYE